MGEYTIGDLYVLLIDQQVERRQWQDEWRIANVKANERAGAGLYRIMLFRGFIELLILIVLVWRMF